MYLQRQLTRDFSSGIRQRGFEIYRSHMVTLLSGNQWVVSANVRGSNFYKVELSRQDNELYVFCECPYFETESACKHIWATILAADDKNYLRGNGDGGPLTLVEDFEPEFGDDVEGEDFPVTGRVIRRP